MTSPLTDLEARLSALEDKHADEQADEQADEEEPATLLQMIDIDPVAATFMMPYVAYAAFAPFVVPAFAVGTAMAAAAAAMGDTSLERGGDGFDALPSLEMQVAGEGEPVRFRSFAELEKSLPPAPPPLYFYPWGLAIGSAYFAAAVGKAAAAAGAAQRLWAPLLPFAAANAAAKPAETTPVLPTPVDAPTAWYWASLWYLHGVSYYALLVQLHYSYAWWCWSSL